jgi:hypothetical protein
MLCFSVDSPDSLENVESKWVGEIAENCPGVKLVLVALKCDLREQGRDEEDEEQQGARKQMIDYKQGLAVAEKIKALRYLGEFGFLLWVVGDKADKTFRMLRNEESRCQRSLHRSRASGVTGQERQGRQVDRMLCGHVGGDAALFGDYPTLGAYQEPPPSTYSKCVRPSIHSRS